MVKLDRLEPLGIESRRILKSLQNLSLDRSFPSRTYSWESLTFRESSLAPFVSPKGMVWLTSYHMVTRPWGSSRHCARFPRDIERFLWVPRDRQWVTWVTWRRELSYAARSIPSRLLSYVNSLRTSLQAPSYSRHTLEGRGKTLKVLRMLLWTGVNEACKDSLFSWVRRLQII